MPLFHVAVISNAQLLLSYYFGTASVFEQDEWEAGLGEELQPFFVTPPSTDVVVACGTRPVVVRSAAGCLLALSGTEAEDELALSSVFGFVIDVITATCDGRLTPQQVIAFHGKIVVCLHEGFPGGHQRYSDTETILRNAKLKAPSV